MMAALADLTPAQPRAVMSITASRLLKDIIGC
jgi:hypothetical protein